MNNLKLLFLFSILICTSFSWAQTQVNEIIKVEQKKLEQALETKNPQAEANAYLALGDQYFSLGNYPKSEEYYQKSQKAFEKLGDTKSLAEVTRKLAQSQENQKKNYEATENFSSASKLSNSKITKNINDNDAQRLENNTLELHEELVQSNIKLNEIKNDARSLSQDYNSLAQIEKLKGNTVGAAKNLELAYEVTKKEEPIRALEFKQKEAEIYLENKDYGKAIEAKAKILQEDFVKNDSKIKATQMQELGDIYLKANKQDEALKMFQNSYAISISKNHILEASKSLLKLDSLYKSFGTPQKSLTLYKNFLSQLPTLLEKDESHLDSKIIKETEDRIEQLEKEKSLNEQLIKRKNRYNLLLILGLALAIGFIAFALYTQNKLKIQNKKIKLQSLRREMNPHFIFNSLNSINQYISENNELEANQYLTRFSKLMRSVMENSKKDFIPFQDEFDLLNSYLILEKNRFNNKFDYKISVSEDLDSNLELPGMLIQPFLENAIWHGLRYKEEKGYLNLTFDKIDNKLAIKIEDNGIGIENSKLQKTEHQKLRKGRGMKNTMERIRLLNDLYGKSITCEILDKKNGQGVLVLINMNI